MSGFMLRANLPDLSKTFSAGPHVKKNLIHGLIIVALLAIPASADQPDLLVEVVTVRNAPLTFNASLTGTIAARNSVNIGFRQGGKVTRVLVNEGDHVRSHQPLAQTDATQQQQAVKVATASAESSHATYQQTRLAFERAEAMLKRGVGTRVDLDAAKQAMSAAKGSLAQAQTALDQARRALEDTTIRAPDDAIVVTRNVNPGQIVAAAQPAFTLAETDGLQAIFSTPDMPVLKQAIGVPISIKGLEPTVPDMSATIREVSPLVDPQTGAVAIKADITDAPANVVLLGAAVRGTVHFPTGHGIEIPQSALAASADGPAVWRVDSEMRVRLVPVTIEWFTDATIVLSSGVTPGDRVVAAGAQLLYPGRRITTLNESAEGAE